MTYKLFCGDCLEIMQSEEYKDAISDKDIIFVSDPPFNMGYHYNTYKDNKKEDEYYEWLYEIFGDNKSVIVHYPESLYKLAIKMNQPPNKVISWVYNSNTAKQHRDIAFWGVEPVFKQVVQPYKNPNDKRIKKLMEAGRLGGRLYDWWNVNQVKNVSKDKTNHPCQMPKEVMENIIGILPRIDNLIVIDPFMGSGTTGVACQKYDIDFIGIELDTEYFKIAQERLDSQTIQTTIFDYMDTR